MSLQSARRVLIAGFVLTLWLSLGAAPASAQTKIGASDALMGSSGSTHFCSNSPCALSGSTPGPTAMAFQAPGDGTITNVAFRSQVELENVGVLIGSGFGPTSFDRFAPLGDFSASADVINVPSTIPVSSGELLFLQADTNGGSLFDVKNEPGGSVAILDPAPTPPADASPAVVPDNNPLVQYTFSEGPTVEERTDIEVVKTFPAGSSYRVGEIVPFDVQVTNITDVKPPAVPAQGVTLVDLHNRGLVFDVAGIPGPGGLGGDCQPTPPADGEDQGSVTCVIGDLAPGEQRVFIFDFIVGPNRTERNTPSELNVASSFPTNTDRDPSNNVSDAEVPIESSDCAPALTVGTPENDELKGKRRPDTIFGRDGNDVIKGKGKDDCLFGHDGKDKIFGDGGSDYVEGGDGNDKIKVRDGKVDVVICGDGKRDKVVGDRKDEVADDCEKQKLKNRKGKGKRGGKR